MLTLMFRNGACYRFYSLCCMMYNRTMKPRFLCLGYMALYHVLNYVKYTNMPFYDEVIDIDYDMNRPGLSITYKMNPGVLYDSHTIIDGCDDEFITVELIKHIVKNTVFTARDTARFIWTGCYGHINDKNYVGVLTVKQTATERKRRREYNVYVKSFEMVHTKTILYAPLVYMLVSSIRNRAWMMTRDDFIERQLKFVKKYKKYMAYECKNGKATWQCASDSEPSSWLFGAECDTRGRMIYLLNKEGSTICEFSDRW